MARRTRVSPPPITKNPSLNQWFNQVTDALNQFPAFSIHSTSAGPNSSVTADPGTLGFDVGSSGTTFWMKESTSTTTGWSSIASHGYVDGEISDLSSRLSSEISSIHSEIDSITTFVPAHAGMYEEEDTPEFTLADADYRDLTWADEWDPLVMSSSTTLGRIYSNDTADYLCAFQSSFTASNNIIYYAYFHKNGVKTDFGCHKRGSANGEGSFSIAPSFITMQPGDYVTVALRSSTSNRVFTNVDGQFSSWKVHQ